jgi:hypothetical protein
VKSCNNVVVSYAMSVCQSVSLPACIWPLENHVADVFEILCKGLVLKFAIMLKMLPVARLCGVGGA